METLLFSDCSCSVQGLGTMETFLLFVFCVTPRPDGDIFILVVVRVCAGPRPDGDVFVSVVVRVCAGPRSDGDVLHRR